MQLIVDELPSRLQEYRDLSSHEVSTLKKALTAKGGKIRGLFRYYSSDHTTASKLTSSNKRAHPSSARLGYYQMMALCRETGISPGLVPRKLCADTFIALSSIPPDDDDLGSLSGSSEEEERNRYGGDTLLWSLSLRSVGYTEFIDWLALVALDSERTFGMRTCDYDSVERRLWVFFNWLETSNSMDRMVTNLEGMHWKQPVVEQGLRELSRFLQERVGPNYS